MELLDGGATARGGVVVEGKTLEFQHYVVEESGWGCFEHAIGTRSVDRYGYILEIDRDRH